MSNSLGKPSVDFPNEAKTDLVAIWPSADRVLYDFLNGVSFETSKSAPKNLNRQRAPQLCCMSTDYPNPPYR